MSLRVGDHVNLTIDRLAIGGRGVARHEGLVFFVEDTAPNESVLARITKLKKNHAEAKVLEILRSSPSRVVPPCPVYGRCGGCNLQHVAYAEQLRQKREFVVSSLGKFAGFPPQEIVLDEVVASPKTWHYRNRVQLHRAAGKIGFLKRGSHDIVDTDQCLIAEESINRQLHDLRIAPQSRSFERIELRASGEEAGEEANEGDGSGFAQVNSTQNQQLVEAVIGKIAEGLVAGATECFFDLYCGSGNFTFPLTRRFPKLRIDAVELNSRLVTNANAQLQPGEEVAFHNQDVLGFLRSQKAQAHPWMLLDPPRDGCGSEVMAEIARLAPPEIFYVSCHPVTLARDLGGLAGEYALACLQAFDMFPQTDHVEVFAHLRRR